MSNQVVCTKCGHGNMIGHMFCAKCGAKLDLKRMSAHNLQKGGRFSFPSLVLAGRLIIALAVVILVVAVILPTEPQGARGIDPDVLKYKEKRAELDRSLLENLDASKEFSEGEINAFLAGVLRSEATNQASVAFWQMRSAEYSVAFLPGAITVHWAATLGPLTVTYEVTGEPQVGQGLFTLKVQSGRWGHLSLPSAAARWMGTRLAVCFNRWQKERTILDHAGAVEVQQGRLILTMKKGRTGGPNNE